jgi:hypothetical protein
VSLTTPFLIAALLNQGLPPSKTNEAQISIRSGSSTANTTHLTFRGPSISLNEPYGLYLAHELFYQSQIQNSYIQTPGFIAGEIMVGRETSPWGVTSNEDIIASARAGYFEMGFHLDKALSKNFFGYQNPYRPSFMVRTGAETLGLKSFHSHIWAKFPFVSESSSYGGDLKYIFPLSHLEDWSLAPNLSLVYTLNPKVHQQETINLFIDPKLTIHVGPELSWKQIASIKIRIPYFVATDGANIKKQYWLAWKYPELSFSLQTKF